MTDQINQETRAKLNSFIRRVEQLIADRKDINKDINEVYSEAKSFGFDTSIMKLVVKNRQKDESELAEEEALLELYMSALDD